MLDSAAELLRERGAAGVTIDSVLQRSSAPRGSVYYHFPGGRDQILTEALRYAGDAITIRIDEAARSGAMGLLHQFVALWEHVLIESDFAAGCPVVAAAVGTADDESALTSVAGEIFDQWRIALSGAFTADGFGERDAQSLATMCIAALEGAVLLCRATRCHEHLRDVARQLEFLIKSKEFVRRNGVPSVEEN